MKCEDGGSAIASARAWLRLAVPRRSSLRLQVGDLLVHARQARAATTTT